MLHAGSRIGFEWNQRGNGVIDMHAVSEIGVNFGGPMTAPANVEIEWSRGKSAEGVPTGRYIESMRVCVENYRVPDDLQTDRACPTTFAFTNEA